MGKKGLKEIKEMLKKGAFLAKPQETLEAHPRPLTKYHQKLSSEVLDVLISILRGYETK